MVQDDQMKDEIRKRIDKEYQTKIRDALNKARAKRLEMKEEKMRLWKERSKMVNLIKEMDNLKLKTFDGEWNEHDLMDEWMIEILVSGLVDYYEEMVNVEGRKEAIEKMIVD